jgi:hypothetical protein
MSLADFVTDVKISASLEAQARQCNFTVGNVDRRLAIDVDREMLLSAVGNLLQNAFKFTQHRTEVSLSAYGAADRIRIDVEDHCGGLPQGFAEEVFQRSSRALATGPASDLGWRSVRAASKPTMEFSRSATCPAQGVSSLLTCLDTTCGAGHKDLWCVVCSAVESRRAADRSYRERKRSSGRCRTRSRRRRMCG